MGSWVAWGQFVESLTVRMLSGPCEGQEFPIAVGRLPLADVQKRIGTYALCTDTAAGGVEILPGSWRSKMPDVLRPDVQQFARAVASLREQVRRSPRGSVVVEGQLDAAAVLTVLDSVVGYLPYMPQSLRAEPRRDADDLHPDGVYAPYGLDVLDKAQRDLHGDDAETVTIKVGEVRKLLAALRMAALVGPRWHKDGGRCYDVDCSRAHTLDGFQRWGRA